VILNREAGISLLTIEDWPMQCAYIHNSTTGVITKLFFHSMNIAGCRRPVPYNINESNRFVPCLSCKIAGSSVTVSVRTKKLISVVNQYLHKIWIMISSVGLGFHSVKVSLCIRHFSVYSR
jgi:hypothetical protein